MTHDERDIRRVLAEYERLLNASDAESMARLYSTDGIFMPQGQGFSSASLDLRGVNSSNPQPIEPRMRRAFPETGRSRSEPEVSENPSAQTSVS